jgi:L-iditol 2-dehydrogenase
MRVAELIAQRRFQLRDAAPPAPAPDEVQVRVEAVGVCGSDLHSYSEGAVGDTPCQYPMVLGHEPSGIITKLGAEVSGWSAGDRVFCEPAIYCYHCEFCRTGHHNVCSRVRFMSMPGDPGFFRGYATLPAKSLLGIPAAFSFAYATLIEPLAVALHSMQFVDIKPGEQAVVLGAGPIGLLTIACLRLGGAGRVWAVDPVAHRLELAKIAGADVALNPQACDPVREILRDTASRGVDVAIDCAAQGGSINQCIHVARNAGRVVITGIPSAVMVSLDFSPMRRKELAFFNVRRSNHESETARDLLAAHPRRFGPIVTHTHALDRIGAAFHQLEHYADGAGKIVIAPEV